MDWIQVGKSRENHNRIAYIEALHDGFWRAIGVPPGLKSIALPYMNLLGEYLVRNGSLTAQTCILSREERGSVCHSIATTNAHDKLIVILLGSQWFSGLICSTCCKHGICPTEGI